MLRGLTRAVGEPAPLFGVGDQHAQRTRQSFHVVGLDQDAGIGRHRIGDRAAGGADHRQAVGDRFGISHAVTLEARREHEQVGAGVECGDTLIR